MQECFYIIKKYKDRMCPSGPFGGPQNLKSPKVLRRLLKVWHNIALERMRVLLICFFNRSVLIFFFFFLIRWPTGFLGSPIILNLRKFFTNCFQNLAQRFSRIQKSFYNIIYNFLSMKMWKMPSTKIKDQWGPCRGPHNLKSSEVLYRLLSKFGTTFHWNTEVR